MKVRKATPADIKKTEDWGAWSKGISEFPWQFSDKETCYILEGQATVVDEKGNEISFTKGDWVEFEKGLSCTWKITKAINKLYDFG
ncbi:MAG: cupin domain-containing protein [Bacteroidales bacterium]|nr:cupin domain-containing protein [Bacteroidales bacterium]